MCVNLHCNEPFSQYLGLHKQTTKPKTFQNRAQPSAADNEIQFKLSNI